MRQERLFGGVEVGGTKVICAIGTGPEDVRHFERFPTTSPDDTLTRVVGFFEHRRPRPVAVGMACFGPLDPNPASPTYGHITTTPKPGWANTAWGPAVARALGVPVAFDTDVNGAVLAEHRWGAGRDVSSLLYITVGTGIGGGALVHGARVHGLLHPEMGHLYLPRLDGDAFAGVCPFHGGCLEGLASGPALRARWGRPGEELPGDHPAWRLEAGYLALALVNFILVLSPERIILGGGVMQQPGLLAGIHDEVRARLKGYVPAPALTDGIESYIVRPALANEAGVLGAIAMAEELVPSP